MLYIGRARMLCQAECARGSGPVQHPRTGLGGELRFSFNQNVLIFILQSNSYTHICEKKKLHSSVARAQQLQHR